MLVFLADVDRGLGNFEQAVETYRQAIALDPESIDAYIGRGWNYGQAGRYDLAIADFDQAIALDPENATAYFYEGHS